MRVGILTPNYYSEETGNAVTVRRIERHLRLLGCEVQVFPVDQMSGEQLRVGIEKFAPQVLHAFHGYFGGRVAHALAESMSIPYVVTLTGSDVYQALSDQRSHDTHTALRGAARLVAFHPNIKHRLAEHLPTLEEKTVVIPQGVEVTSPDLEVNPDLQVVAKDADVPFIFFLPAGLRPVKNVLFPLQPLADLHARYPQIRLQIAGPVLAADYAAEVFDALEGHAFARYLGKVPHQRVGALYEEADVVLNCSLFEGGMANSLLEALAHGKAVLAADIEGNRSVIKEGVTGLLYREAANFVQKAEELVTSPQLRAKLGKNGKAMVREKHAPEKEAQAYLDLYRAVLSRSE